MNEKILKRQTPVFENLVPDFEKIAILTNSSGNTERPSVIQSQDLNVSSTVMIDSYRIEKHQGKIFVIITDGLCRGV